MHICVWKASFAFMLLLLLSISFAAYQTYEECFQKCPADYAAGKVWGCDEAYCGVFPKASELNKPPEQPEQPTAPQTVNIPGMECQSKCINEQVTCMKPCDENFPSCTMACPEGDAYDACWQKCMDTKDSCESACLGPKYTGCLKPCYLAQGIPKECVDKYDTLNQEPFLQCLLSLQNKYQPTTPPVQPSCNNDGKCDFGAGETLETCPADCSEICYDGIDNDQNGYTDCQDPACKGNPACGAINGRVTMIDVEGERVLKDVPVIAQWETENGIAKSQPVYTNEKGEYSIDAPAIHEPGTDNIYVIASLTRDDGPFSILEGPKSIPVQSIRPVDKENLASGASQEIVLENLNKEDNTHPRDAGKIYFHLLQVNKFFGTLTGGTGILGHERIYDYHDVLFGSNAAYHSPNAGAGAGIYFGSDNAKYTSLESPTNREYHEYGHHLMDQVLGMPSGYHWDGKSVMYDNNHDGIKNHCSADSWVEGFAEFMSLAANYQTQVPRRCGSSEAYAYCVGSTPYLIELNYKAEKDEEIAVAGILWDLYDDASIDLGPDDDAVSVDMQTLWGTIKKQRALPLYYTYDTAPRDVWYVQDLYDAASEDKLGTQDQIDAIFKSHGFYYLNESSGKEAYGSTVWVFNNATKKYYLQYKLAKNDTKFFIRR